MYSFKSSQTGTTTLLALPLGAILCFLNLLGARAFSRGELYLQKRFHQVYLPSYQPRPLFRRLREPAVGDHESGRVPCNVGNANRLNQVKEHSFYKNTYDMVRPETISSNFLTQVLSVHWSNVLPSTILLPRHQARDNTANHPSSHCFWHTVAHPRPPCARGFPGNKENWRVASQYRNRGIVPCRAVILCWLHLFIRTGIWIYEVSKGATYNFTYFIFGLLFYYYISLYIGGSQLANRLSTECWKTFRMPCLPSRVFQPLYRFDYKVPERFRTFRYWQLYNCEEKWTHPPWVNVYIWVWKVLRNQIRTFGHNHVRKSDH